MGLPYVTADGEHHTRAPAGAQYQDAEGHPYVWIRTNDGDIRKARPAGEV